MLCRIIIILHVVDSSQVAVMYICSFIYRLWCLCFGERIGSVGWLVGSVSIHEMNESPFQAETVPAAQSVAR